MNFEAPVDGIYVWLGVALASTLVAGVALSLPTQPPPDAGKVANTVDDVHTSRYAATATIEHEATAVKVGLKSIAMRNDGGVTHATISTGTMTPIASVENESRAEKLARILAGNPPRQVLDGNVTRTLADWQDDIQRRLEDNSSRWRERDSPLRVRLIPLDSGIILLVGVV